jgi:hypothetical protein
MDSELYNGYARFLHSGNIQPPYENILDKVKSLVGKKKSSAQEEKRKAEIRLGILQNGK